MRRREDRRDGAPAEDLVRYVPEEWAGRGGHSGWHEACLAWFEANPRRLLAGRGEVEQWHLSHITRPLPGRRPDDSPLIPARRIIEGVDQDTGEVIYPELAAMIQRYRDGKS